MGYQHLDASLRRSDIVAGIAPLTVSGARATAWPATTSPATMGKVALRSSRFGRGVYATRAIARGEVVLAFDGPVYEARHALDLPPQAVNHAIQFAENKWRDSDGIARFINHSCEPNCGMR